MHPDRPKYILGDKITPVENHRNKPFTRFTIIKYVSNINNWYIEHCMGHGYRADATQKDVEKYAGVIKTV